MKRFILAFAIVASLSAAAYGAAAALDVEGNTLQAGGDTSLTCDTSGVQVWWNVQWNTDDYYVHNVSIGGVDSGCNGKTIVVTLTKNGSYLAQKSGTVGVSNPTFDFDSPPTIKASDVTDVHVAIIN
jgi:hypothetical protein